MSRWQAIVLALALLAGASPPACGQQILVVHLPSAPVAAAGDQAEAITAFVEYLAARLPGRDFEPEIFRRWPDVEDYLRQGSADVALMLSDAALAHDRSTGLTPASRMGAG